MLLCVQELAKDRPSISIVVSMLCSEIAHLPPPKPPAYSERQITIDRVLQEPKLVFSEPSNCYKRPSPVEIRLEKIKSLFVMYILMISVGRLCSSSFEAAHEAIVTRNYQFC